MTQSSVDQPAAREGVFHRLTTLLFSLLFWKIFLTGVSFYTTTRGLALLYDVFGEDHGDGSMGSLTLIIPVSVGGALHALIYFALGRWASLRRHVYFLAMALPLQLVAVATSYGTHWVHMRGPSVTAQDYIATQSDTVRGIGLFAQSYASMADALGSLTGHSEQQAQIEDKSGTSCGSRAGGGKGSRYNLRMSDRATFSAFNGEVAKRVADLQALVSRAEKMTAVNATEAMANLPELRRIVDQAKVFEADPLLQNLKTAAEQREQAGKAPMAGTAGNRRKGAASAFVCPDVVLDRLLQVVVDAVDGIKPVPEITTQDSRNPRVGFAKALRRLAVSVLGSSFLPPSRAQLVDDRRRQLVGTATLSDGIQSDDMPPLAVAAIIEALLTILFWFAGGSIRNHPGVADLRDLALRQADSPVFERVWHRLGGSVDRPSLRRVVADHAKFERSQTLVFVPIYSKQRDHRALHDLMLLLRHVGLARLPYTGSLMAGVYALGLPADRRAALRAHGAIRVFRMSAVDYVAFTLDGVGHPHTDDDRSHPPSNAAAANDDMPMLLGPDRTAA